MDLATFCVHKSKICAGKTLIQFLLGTIIITVVFIHV